MDTKATSSLVPRLPVYFISHGGPPIMEWPDHPAYKAFAKFGKEVAELKPKGIVALSAHFAGKPDEIYINHAESTDLVYDFFGFPEHYYQVKFPHKGSASLAADISRLLSSANIKSRLVKRGLDHGIWIPFRIAFSPEQQNRLNVPIVQVSLFASEDPRQHIDLGKALSSLRQSGYVIVASGQAVHNLRDLSFAESDSLPAQPLPYVSSFDVALESAMSLGNVELREHEMVKLLQRADARAAHPHFDHILPMYVALGAAGGGHAKQIFNHRERSLGWAQYRLD